MRIVSRSNPRPRALNVICPRHIHITQPRLASEVPKDPLTDPSVQAFYEKIRNHQGAIDAMMGMRKIMESKGYDVTKPPSTMQMMKMGLDGDLRRGATKLMDEFQKAGVELNPETVKELFSKMKLPE